ncbi:hypothetical protein GCM10027080_18150 [Pedococcus soli]
MDSAARRVEPEGMGTPLDDRDLAAEIALLGEVMAAVAAAADELSDSEVDDVLGVSPAAGTGADEPVGGRQPAQDQLNR